MAVALVKNHMGVKRANDRKETPSCELRMAYCGEWAKQRLAFE